MITKKEINLAKVGLIAIIDEVTGYQTERFKDKKALGKPALPGKGE